MGHDNSVGIFSTKRGSKSQVSFEAFQPYNYENNVPAHFDRQPSKIEKEHKIIGNNDLVADETSGESGSMLNKLYVN